MGKIFDNDIHSGRYKWIYFVDLREYLGHHTIFESFDTIPNVWF